MFGRVLYRSVYKRGGVYGEFSKNTADLIRKKDDGPLYTFNECAKFIDISNVSQEV